MITPPCNGAASQSQVDVGVRRPGRHNSARLPGTLQFHMPKHLFRKYLPSPDRLKGHKSLSFLGEVLSDPNLWHINRHSVARAFLVGIWFCFIPMPFQMIGAALFAIWFNSNLPLSVVLVWISNPVTMPPIFYFNYKVGAWVLNRPVLNFQFELTWSWISERLLDIGIPLYLGSLMVATISACIAYLTIQFLWRRKIRADWRLRRGDRLKRQRAADQAS